MQKIFKFGKIHKRVKVDLDNREYFVISRQLNKIVGIAKIEQHHCQLPGLNEDECAISISVRIPKSEELTKVVANGKLRPLNLGESLKSFLIE
jgi:hypothetical protein